MHCKQWKGWWRKQGIIIRALSRNAVGHRGTCSLTGTFTITQTNFCMPTPSLHYNNKGYPPPRPLPDAMIGWLHHSSVTVSCPRLLPCSLVATQSVLVTTWIPAHGRQSADNFTQVWPHSGDQQHSILNSMTDGSRCTPRQLMSPRLPSEPVESDVHR